MTIYIDIVIIENIIMNSIILYATAIILKAKISHIRIIISSIIGATYAIITYIYPIKIYNNIFFKILLSVIMVYVAYKPQNIKRLGKNILIFYLTSFLFGGVAFALIYVIKPQEILMKNGLFLGTYPLKTVFISAIIATIILITGFKIVKSKISKKDIYCKIKIKLDNKEVETIAMVDTGNMLKEPITQMPVVVVESSLLEKILPQEILKNTEKIIGGEFENVTEKIKNKYISKFKLIPYSSLGKQNGMLLGIKADKVEIEKQDEIIEKNNIIIGIYNKSLTKRGEYRALIGIDEMWKKERKMINYENFRNAKD